jgi:hypothetical protein
MKTKATVMVHGTAQPRTARRPRINRMKASVGIIAALALSLAALVAPTPGVAASNVPGPYVAGSGYCWDSTHMVATPPGMTPAPNAPTSYVGGGQEVGFRAVLQRYSSGQWYDYIVGPLQKRFAGYTVLGDELWLNTTDKTYSQGNVYFSVRNTGTQYFRVFYRMYWYINGAVSGSASSVAWGHFENRADKINVPGWSTYSWCRY